MSPNYWLLVTIGLVFTLFTGINCILPRLSLKFDTQHAQKCLEIQI